MELLVGVYKFRTQQCNENLLILYANVGDKPVTLTFNEVIAEANMCSLGTKIKPKINSITKQSNPDRSKELWSKLKLEQNEFLSSDSKLRPALFKLIGEYQDVFSSNTCKVGDTSWVEFKIDLNLDAQSVKKGVRPLPSPP